MLKLILILIIAFLVHKVSMFISSKTKIPEYLLYLLIGILLGKSGFVNVFGSEFLTEPMSEFNEIVSLVVLMLGASLTLNFDLIKKSGKLVSFLSVVPLYIESFVMGAVLYFILQIVPLGFEVNIFETILVAVLLGPVQPAVIMPHIIKLVKGKEKTKNNVDSTFLLSSILENFTGIPLIFTLAAILLALANTKGAVSVGSIATTSLIVIVVIIIFAIVVFFLGKLFIKITNNTLLEKCETNNQYIAYGLLSVLVAVLIVKLSGPLAALSILAGLMFGMGMNNSMRPEKRAKIQHIAEEMFNIFCAPLIFLAVGGEIVLSEIFSVKVLVVGISFFFISIVVKSLVTTLYLNKKGFTKAEIKYIKVSYLAKGVGAINVVGVLIAMFAATSYHTSTLLTYIAIIEILISFPLYNMLIKKAQENIFDQ